MEVHGKTVGLDVQEKRGGEIFVQLQSLKPLALIDVGRWHLLPFAWMGHGRLSPRKVHDSAKLDAGADVVDDSGGEIRIFFRVVNQQGDLGQADFFRCGKLT